MLRSIILRSRVSISRRTMKTVLIEGNIAAGKTTFISHLSKIAPNALIFNEPVDDWKNFHGINMLELLYKDHHRYSAVFQSYVQLTMAKQHEALSSSQINKSLKIMERSIFSARYCFVENLWREGLIPKVEFLVLNEWFEFLSKSYTVDMIIYLRTSPQTSLDRIKLRGRDEESTVPLSYLTSLHNLHDDWLVNKKFPVPAKEIIVIDADNFSTEELSKQIVSQISV